MTGLIHIYTGNGKGKTTASLGLAFRAMGKGFTVHFIQFMKGDLEYGEVKTAERFPEFHLKQFGRPVFVDKKNPAEVDIRLAQQGLEYARETMSGLPDSGRKMLMVLDELNVALDFNLLNLEDVLDILHNKPSELELVITGRYAMQELIDIADYVTEMKEIKHPYMKGILARNGIEH